MDKTIIETIKELFNTPKEDVEVNVSENFADYKTEDGKILRAENLDVDSAIVEITEEGETPLDNGTYTILDLNLIIEVDGGIIKSVQEIEVDEEEVAEEVAEEEVEEEMAEGDEANEDESEEVEVEVKDINDETLAVGDKVSKEDELLTEGEHKLEDGRTLVIDIDSLIVEIIENEEEVVEEDMEEDNSPELNNENKFEGMEELITLFQDLKNEMDSLKEENKKLTEMFTKFSGEPAEDTLVTKVDFTKMEKDDKLKFFSKK